MWLKALMKIFMFINEAIKYSNSTENDIYKNYPYKHDLKELKEIFSNIIQYTQNQELKKSLEIILILISHKNGDIRASALGKLFFLMDDESIQRLIIKELKNMLHNRESFSEFADHSLDSISAEIYKIEIIEIFEDILSKLNDTIKFDVVRSKFSFSIFSQDRKVSTVPETDDTQMMILPANLFNKFLCWFHTFNFRIDKMAPYLDENKGFHNKKLIKHEITSYFHLQNLEFSKNDSLQRLASFYAITSMEKGHLRRLIALLDDDDTKVRQIGVNALIKVVKKILTNCDDKNLSDNFT